MSQNDFPARPEKRPSGHAVQASEPSPKYPAVHWIHELLNESTTIDVPVQVAGAPGTSSPHVAGAAGAIDPTSLYVHAVTLWSAVVMIAAHAKDAPVALTLTDAHASASA